MSTDKGYIVLYRDIRDHWIWGNAKTLRAWIDIIMLANHTDTKVHFNGHMITVKRGSFITSVRNLAKRWGWGKDTVLQFLRDLEADGMIDRKPDTQKTLITVVNYDVYQDAGRKKQTRSGTHSGTQTGTHSGTRSRHSEYITEGITEDIKERNKKKEIFSSLDDDDEPDLEGWEDP